MAKKQQTPARKDTAKLPDYVYVGINNPGDRENEFLSAHTDPAMVTNLEGNPGNVMGEYELKRVVRFREETTTYLDTLK